jgi:hypothetical protein
MVTRNVSEGFALATFELSFQASAFFGPAIPSLVLFEVVPVQGDSGASMSLRGVSPQI